MRCSEAWLDGAGWGRCPVRCPVCCPEHSVQAMQLAKTSGSVPKLAGAARRCQRTCPSMTPLAHAGQSQSGMGTRQSHTAFQSIVLAGQAAVMPAPVVSSSQAASAWAGSWGSPQLAALESKSSTPSSSAAGAAKKGAARPSWRGDQDVAPVAVEWAARVAAHG